jgi:O-antigen ligase
MLAESKNEAHPFRFFVSFYAISALMLLGVVAAMVIDPKHAWMNEGHGVQRLATTSTFMMGANTIGVVAALLSLSALSRFMCLLKTRYLVLSGAFLALCYMARSRTGFIVFALGLLVLTAFLCRMPSRRVITMASGILLGVLVIGLCFVSPEFTDTVTYAFTRGHNEANISSLDGRVSIWTAALNAFEQSPILGSGYATYPMRIEAGSHFHNMFVELAVTTGILGLIPIVILFTVLTVRLVKLFSCHISDAMPDHIPALDALLIGTVLIVSEMTTAGAAYYSWQMIGIVALAIGLYSMPMAQETRSINGDDVSEATVMRQTLIPITESTDFKSDRNSIIL